MPEVFDFWLAFIIGDCAITTLSEIISLGGNAASSDSCNFEHSTDLDALKPGDFKLRPMSSDGKIFSDDINYIPLKTQDEFNFLKPQVQLYAQDWAPPLRFIALTTTSSVSLESVAT